eukprot:9721744-Ditylum_brightwellii.AAC.1
MHQRSAGSDKKADSACEIKMATGTQHCSVARLIGTTIPPSLKNNHVFSCPVYALDSDLQARKLIPKWNPQAQLGLNLGPSPCHAAMVNLALNLETGLISPQFHAQYNNFFKTVCPTVGNAVTFSNWQMLAGL